MLHPAGVEHTLNVVWCGKPEGDLPSDLYSEIKGDVKFREYLGAGWDLGAYQEIVRGLDCDLVMCLATPVHFHQDDWLVPMVKAFNRHGDGVYGPMASRENSEHIRTGAFAITPCAMRAYPNLIDSREKCFRFESGFTSQGGMFEDGEWNITNWAEATGRVALMVTRSGCHSRKHWRSPQNIFRRGDQSNCLVWDRHCDIYNDATPEMKRTLERLADGVPWQNL